MFDINGTSISAKLKPATPPAVQDAIRAAVAARNAMALPTTPVTKAPPAPPVGPSTGWPVMTGGPGDTPPAKSSPAPVPVALDVQPTAGMIFLARVRNGDSAPHWQVAFHGIAGLPSSMLPVPVACEATLRDVLEWLGAAHKGKLAGAWLTVAPAQK